MALHQHRRNERGNERGQVIVIAIAVMFLLAFIAGLFLTIITRNIGRTARGGDVLQAQYLAEAGIRYADQQLTHSMEGADWRPEPDTAYEAADNTSPLAGDPDYSYLHEGYTRFNQGNGRFLLRVSYEPVQTDANGDAMDSGTPPQVTTDRSKMVYPALGKYIKIECIGRRGVVDAADPTTWRNADPLVRQLVAYKPIGITDYARFVTNKDRSDNTMTLGSDPFPLPTGNPNDTFRTSIYGPIRVNGDLQWTGLDSIFLNTAEAAGGTAATQYPTALEGNSDATMSVHRYDTVAVAGRIFHAPEGLPNPAPANQVHIGGWREDPANPLAMLNLDADVTPSDDPAFKTVDGMYRDASAGQSASGGLRGIARLEPPLMDTAETSTGILRYRLITRNTGIVPDGKTWNTGQYGLGLGIYIDNNNEIQKDNQYRRLTDEWSNPGTGNQGEASPGSAWRQNLYTPPGAEIYLDPTPSRTVNTAFPADQSQGTIIITRHDGRQWRDENGHNEGYTRRYRYPRRQVFDNTGALVDQETYDNDGTTGATADPYRDSTGAYKTFQNGVIFLEGNVRIQGKLPADWTGPKSGQVRGAHLTIVTMGTAYIEGNLLKGDAASGNINKFGNGLQLGSITVIAKGYVCVNSTAYFMKQPDSPSWNFGLGNPYTELAAAGEQFVTSGFSAVDPARYNDDAGSVVYGTSTPAKQRLWLLQTAESAPGAAADFDLYAYAGSNGIYQSGSLFGAGKPMTVTPGQSALAPAENIWQHMGIPLLPAPNQLATSWELKGAALPDWYSLTYRPYFGTTSPYGSGTSGGAEFTQDYREPLWISRVALSPADIRIEAVLYAQEGSFFVIPGEWMNTNTYDQRGASVQDSLRYDVNGGGTVRAGWRVEDLVDANGNLKMSGYPFYAEPPDIRVVIDGAIAENVPADKDYQTAWSKHWGWTPEIRPDDTRSVHNGEGLVYMYDNDLRLPLRYDQYNRPLPPTPALPVSPDLVFFGEAS